MFNLKNLIDTVDRWMAAVTFAEAGEHETALDVLHDGPQEQAQQRSGIRTPSRDDRRPDLRM